ncbi:protein PLANT CADMIUM RESISTANCE 3 [Physcomitrium patens]|uniref:Uncharacterized protein n=1 Tax=Physcomitrium patens TaxID=3218 RepID=A0A2K1KSR6_PHYPA|nr:protein PLANT CADMIUM RESISTANCE 3-like [Physcomitrium patens]PNR56825.1 hypothetical protein PHYPA_003817 [Physcomitrium patens]|eukprot:XP_024369239.1 protein PLANT CADMIUM RESISTANCE 3-like [Physcomitrella patens]
MSGGYPNQQYQKPVTPQMNYAPRAEPPGTAYPPQPAGMPPQQYHPRPKPGYPQHQMPPQVVHGGAQQVQGQHPLGQWTTGLCDCGDDPTNFCIAFCCTCITFGQIAEVIDQGATSCLLAGAGWLGMLMFTGCPCAISCLWRGKLRAKYNIQDDAFTDFCIHCWCEPCAVAQEFRELKNRGLDPALGWSLLSQQGYGAQPMGIPMQAPMQR